MRRRYKRRRTVGFYTDDEGRVRPITKGVGLIKLKHPITGGTVKVKVKRIPLWTVFPRSYVEKRSELEALSKEYARLSRVSKKIDPDLLEYVEKALERGYGITEAIEIAHGFQRQRAYERKLERWWSRWRKGEKLGLQALRGLRKNLDDDIKILKLEISKVDDESYRVWRSLKGEDDPRNVLKMWDKLKTLERKADQILGVPPKSKVAIVEKERRLKTFIDRFEKRGEKRKIKGMVEALKRDARNVYGRINEKIGLMLDKLEQLEGERERINRAITLIRLNKFS